jgi:hypothetical protein
LKGKAADSERERENAFIRGKVVKGRLGGVGAGERREREFWLTLEVSILIRNPNSPLELAEKGGIRKY